MTKVFLDLETTGLNEYNNGVWQLACLAYPPDGMRIDINLEFSPLPDDEVDSRAFDHAARTKEEVWDLPKPAGALKEFKEFMEIFIDPYDSNDKAFMYAYNARFDEKFLRQWFYKQGDKYFGSWFWFPPIDIMNIAMEFLKEERAQLPNFKQGTVAKHLGIEVDEDRLHDALYDIEISKKIYDHITSARAL